MKRSGVGAALAAMVSSAITLACCLPLGLAGAAGAASLALVVKSARPWLLILSVGMLLLGFVQVYRGRRFGVKQSRIGIILLCLAAVLVVLVSLFPQVIAGFAADILDGFSR